MSSGITDEIISSLVFFSTAPRAARDIIAKKGVLIDAEPEQVLFDERDTSREVYFVVNGTILISILSEGAEVPLATFERGSCFGEMSALDGITRSGKAATLEKATLLKLDHQTFCDLVEEYKEISHAVIRRLIETIRGADLRISELSTLPETARVTRELIRLSRPDLAGDGFYIPSVPNHTELSLKTGAPPGRIAEILGWLNKEGIVARDPKKLKSLLIKNFAKLKLMASGDE